MFFCYLLFYQVKKRHEIRPTQISLLLTYGIQYMEIDID